MQTGRCRFNEDCAFAHEDSEVLKIMLNLESEMETFKANFIKSKSSMVDANINSRNSNIDILEK